MVIHEINNINEISLEELLALKNSKLHKYDDSILIRGSAPGEDDFKYTIEELIVIKQKIKAIVDGVPDVAKNDPDREKKIFSYVYVELANMLKDDEDSKQIYNLSGYYLDRAEDAGVIMNVSSSKSLYGLCSGKTLWCGASLILKTVLAELGIEAKTVYSGRCYFDQDEPRDAWTQVKLDGVWYNADLDGDKLAIQLGKIPRRFLITDSELPFEYGDRFGVKEDCTHKLSNEEKSAIISPIIAAKEKEKNIEKIKREKEALEQKTREEKERIAKEEKRIEEEISRIERKLPPFLRGIFHSSIEKRVRKKFKK